MSSRANPAARWLQKERAANPKSQPEVSGGGGGDGCGRARGRSVSRFPRGSAPPPREAAAGGGAGDGRGARGEPGVRDPRAPTRHPRSISASGAEGTLGARGFTTRTSWAPAPGRQVSRPQPPAAPAVRAGGGWVGMLLR